MDANTGYIVTEHNAHVVATISGHSLKTVLANKGWVVVYQEEPYPTWRFYPKNVAEKLRDFKYVDSALNGLPTRSVEDIRKEWAEVNDAYAKKLDALQKELERAELIEGSQKKQGL